MIHPVSRSYFWGYDEVAALNKSILIKIWQNVSTLLTSLWLKLFPTTPAHDTHSLAKFYTQAPHQNFVTSALSTQNFQTEPQKRAQARALGYRAEIFAALWLMLKGYSLLNWRFILKGGELDLILRRGRTIAFVEIKARNTHIAALEAVSPQKIRRLRHAARHWLMCNPWARDFSLRGDIVTFAKGAWPKHCSNAFELWT